MGASTRPGLAQHHTSPCRQRIQIVAAPLTAIVAFGLHSWALRSPVFEAPGLIEHTCSLEVRAYASGGERIHSGSVELVAARMRIRLGKETKVPCGDHDIVVQALGYRTAKRKLVVREMHQLATMVIPPGSISGESAALRFVLIEIVNFEPFRECDVTRLSPVIPTEGGRSKGAFPAMAELALQTCCLGITYCPSRETSVFAQSESCDLVGRTLGPPFD